MTVEVLVTVAVEGPEVPETLAEEERIEAGAVKQVSEACKAAGLYVIHAETASEAWADLNEHRLSAWDRLQESGPAAAA